MILAGISINAIIGDDGLIKKAQESANLSNEADAKETINRAILEFYTSREYATLKDFLETKVKKGTIDSVVENLDGTLTILKNGYTVNSENKTQTTSKNNGSGSGSSTDTKVPATATTETAPYFPDGTFTKKEGTIDTGLVIQDSVGNEYVWVVVPKTLYDNINYNSNGAKKPSSSTDYENIEYCLQQYTSVYRNGTDYTDTWDADTINEGWFADETAYNTEKQKMLKSVYENGGFYVGRYEAGIETTGNNRKNSSEFNSNWKYDITGMPIPISKADAYPYTYVTRTQAQNLAKKLSEGKTTYTSSLMYGVQWNLVLAFVAKDTTKITNVTVLTGDSTVIGNYIDNIWTITNSKARYLNGNDNIFNACPTPFKKDTNSEWAKLLTTGADSSFLAQNIYDIAGNVWEWTLEKSTKEETSTANGPCVCRGGCYYNIGSEYPASSYDDYNIGYNWRYHGFRVSLW